MTCELLIVHIMEENYVFLAIQSNNICKTSTFQTETKILQISLLENLLTCIFPRNSLFHNNLLSFSLAEQGPQLPNHDN